MTRETRDKSSSVVANWKCLSACTLVSMASFQYGLDFTMIGGFQAMIGFLQVYGKEAPETPLGWNIDYTRQQLISSLMTLGAFISSSSAGFIATYMGRKPSLYLSCLLIYVSTIVMMTTTSIGALYAGRLIIGLGNGILLTSSQLYIQECAPAYFRGIMISIFMCWTSIGSLIGTIIDNFTEKIIGKNSYIIPLGLIFIIPVILCVGMFFIPESPRWLLQHEKREQARKALLWLRPDPSSVDPELDDMQAALDAEKALAASVSVWDMFTNPVDRRRTVLAVCGVTLQAASGAMYMIAYGTYFFEMAGVGNAFENSCILTAIGVVAIMINSTIMGRIGRRRNFLMSGLIICAISQLITAIVYDVRPNDPATGKVIVALAVIFIFGYNGMISSYAWVSGGELPSQRLRSYTFGLAAAIGFLGAWLTTFTAPYFINPDSLNWGPRYGYIWFGSCIVAATWVFFFLPEVKNRTLEEIDEMFEMRLPARKFRTYVCVGREALAALEKKNAGDDDNTKTEKDNGSKNENGVVEEIERV